MEKRVLTIQDLSCVGQCSLGVALPLISAFGLETCALPSAVLSTHTASGFEGYTFRDLTSDMPAIRCHFQQKDIKFDYIYTGYIGNENQLDEITKMKETCLNENGILIVDPVIGDNGKAYPSFNSSFVLKMKKFACQSQLIMPNITEACLLTGQTYKTTYDKKYICELVDRLFELNGNNIILTGVELEKGKIGVALKEKESQETQFCFTSKVDGTFHGTGDIFASVVVGGLACGFDLKTSSELGVRFVAKSIQATCDKAEHWYGVRFEKCIPWLVKKIRQNCANKPYNTI